MQGLDEPIIVLQAMVRYCRIFQYLFRLKRMQLELDKAWLTFGGARGSFRAASETLPDSQPLWHVHSHMAHFMNNLQLYLQVEISEDTSYNCHLV